MFRRAWIFRLSLVKTNAGLVGERVGEAEEDAFAAGEGHAGEGEGALQFAEAEAEVHGDGRLVPRVREVVHGVRARGPRGLYAMRRQRRPDAAPPPLRPDHDAAQVIAVRHAGKVGEVAQLPAPGDLLINDRYGKARQPGGQVTGLAVGVGAPQQAGDRFSDSWSGSPAPDVTFAHWQCSV